MNKRIVAALMAIYPASWRKEYGPEFRHRLEALKFRSGTLINVLWHGIGQRVRATQPWLLLALPFAVVATIYSVVMILAPPPYDASLDRSVAPSTIIVLANVTLSLAVILGCGILTVFRNGGTMAYAGFQTVKMALLIHAPHLLVGGLITAGILGVTVIGPGDSPAALAERGFTMAVYSADATTPNPVVLYTAMLIDVSLCWILGALGGGLGRVLVHKPTPETS